jgi:hypothetical protein
MKTSRFYGFGIMLTIGLLAWANLNASSDNRDAAIQSLVEGLMNHDETITRMPFSSVIMAATGQRVLPYDPANSAHQRMAAAVSEAMVAILKEANQPDDPIHGVGRVNEVSGHFENRLLDKLDALEDFACTYPTLADGSIQRAGYPDLRLEDLATGTVFYLDPKLYRDGSENSTFRTFYYEPKQTTNKVRDDAVHVIVGIAHQGRQNDQWVFSQWQLIDLSGFEVRLKAEFQGSNRDLYRDEAVILQSEK